MKCFYMLVNDNSVHIKYLEYNLKVYKCKFFKKLSTFVFSGAYASLKKCIYIQHF